MVRVRSCVRVVEPSRWDRTIIDRVVGIPGQTRPTEDGEPTPDDVESAEKPHDFAEEEIDP